MSTETAPAPPENRPTPSSSSLGGAKAIHERFQAFQRGEDTSVNAPKQSAPAPSPTHEGAPSEPAKVPEAKAQSTDSLSDILPKAPKAEPEKKPDAPKGKVGSDGLYPEERKELLAFKEKAARVDELETKVKDYEATTRELAELKALKMDMEEKLKRTEAKANAFDVRSSEHFQEAIAKPMETMVGAVEAICKSASLDSSEVFAAIFNPDTSKGNEALSEFMAILNAKDAKTLDRVSDDMRDLDRKANDLIAKAPDALLAIQAEEKKQSEAKKQKEAQEFATANESILPDMESRFPFLKEGGMSNEVLEAAKSTDFSSMNPVHKAAYAQAFQVALRFNPIIEAKDKEIASLKAALKKNAPSGPINGNRPAEESPKDASDKAMEGMTTGQRLVAHMASLRGS